MLWLVLQQSSSRHILGKRNCLVSSNCSFPPLISAISYHSCLIIFNGTFRFIKSRFFIRIPHVKRIIANVCAMTVGYLLISVSCIIPTDYIAAFVVSLGASCIHGLTACFGESTMLGYLKGFPAELVVGWSSGTGFAGVFGAGLVVLLLALHFDLFVVSGL